MRSLPVQAIVLSRGEVMPPERLWLFPVPSKGRLMLWAGTAVVGCLSSSLAVDKLVRSALDPLGSAEYGILAKTKRKPATRPAAIEAMLTRPTDSWKYHMPHTATTTCTQNRGNCQNRCKEVQGRSTGPFVPLLPLPLWLQAIKYLLSPCCH